MWCNVWSLEAVIQWTVTRLKSCSGKLLFSARCDVTSAAGSGTAPFYPKGRVSFQVFLNSLFSDDPNIRRCLCWTTDVMQETINKYWMRYVILSSAAWWGCRRVLARLALYRTWVSREGGGKKMREQHGEKGRKVFHWRERKTFIFVRNVPKRYSYIIWFLVM